MTIRPATVADVPAVLPMVEKIAALHEKWDPARYDYKPNPSERYHRWLTQRALDPRAVFLVADHDKLLADVPFIARRPMRLQMPIRGARCRALRESV